MGRPTKGTVDYFPHYINAGKTLFILENDYGNDGYAFWFKLLEILGGTEGMYFDYNSPADVRFLLSKTQVDEVKCLQIIETLALVHAIDKELWDEHRILWVQNLVDNVRDAFKKRINQVPQKPVFTRSKDGVSSIIVVSAGRNSDSGEFPAEETGKGKESKEKEKLKEREMEMKLKKDADIRSVYEHWKSKSILTNHRSLTVHIQNQINYKLNDYSVDELKECIHHYSVILADPDYKLDTKWSLHDFLEKNHFEKFLTERDPYKFYPKLKKNKQSSQNEQLMREIEVDMQIEQARGKEALPDHQ